MRLLNRTGISVSPSESLWEWLDQVLATPISPDQRHSDEGCLYLVPECHDEEDLQAALAVQAEHILVNELEGFAVPSELWPKPLDVALLERLFKVQIQVVCFDLCDQNLLLADIPEVM